MQEQQQQRPAKEMKRISKRLVRNTTAAWPYSLDCCYASCSQLLLRPTLRIC